MKRFVVLLMLSPLWLAAQQSDRQLIDSLLSVLPQQKADTARVELLSRLSFTYLSTDPGEGIKRGEEALALADTLKWKKGMAMASNSLGLNYKARSDYPKALEYYFKALELNEAIGNKKGIAQNCGNIGIIYKLQNDFPGALDYYTRALNLSEEIDDQKGVAINLGNIGILYNTQRKFSQALDYELRALEKWKMLKSKRSVALWLGNIAIVYGDSGEYEQALSYANEALLINEELGNKKGMADNYRSLGAFHSGIAKNAASPVLRSESLARAKEYLAKALEIATALGDLRNLQEINDILTGVYELSGEHALALKSHRQYVLFKDSIFSMDSKKMIANLEAKREAELNKKELEIVNRQREIDQEAAQRKTMYLVAGIGALVVVSALLFSLYRVKRRSNVKLQHALDNLKETQQQLIQQEKLASLGQMTAAIAHEIQNPLNFVTNFSSLSRELVDDLQATDSPAERAELISLLKGNLSKIEHHSQRSDQVVKAMLMHTRTGAREKLPTDLNHLCEEMAILAVQAAKLEHPGFEFQLERTFTPGLPKIKVVPQEISRVVLNLLNNAVYAVKGRPAAKISVSTSRSGAQLVIAVKDNGAGIPAELREQIFQPFFTTKPAGEGTGLGLSISHDIVKAHGGSVSVNFPAEGGSEFVVTLPAKE